MAEKSYAQPREVNFEPIRAGLWLVIDLIDDLLEYTDSTYIEAMLRHTRGKTLDTLSLIRRVECDTTPGSAPLRLEPGDPAA